VSDHPSDSAAPGRRLGLTVPLDALGIPLAAHRAVFEHAAASGFTDLWSAETNGADAFTPLALAAAWTPALRLGTAVVPVHTRGPALIAMSAAALAEAAPGRFALGIGASSPAIVERWNGVPFEAPYARVRDVLRFLRRALAGEKVDERYETFTVRGFRLAAAPASPPPILLAALRPGMIRLGAREADGVITNWLAAGDVPAVVGQLGDRAGSVELAARIFVCPTRDADYARRLGRMLISSYLTVPAYAEFHRWLGRGEALGPMWAAWEAGDRKAANGLIPDEVVDALLVHGSPEECRAHVRRYAEAGIDTPILALMPTPETTDPHSSAAARAEALAEVLSVLGARSA
jgi:probable F420-dependent oxidoreductase